MKYVKDYMNRKVVYLDPEMNIFEAAKVLAQHNISGAPVVKDGKLVGMLSVSDILKTIKKKVKIKESEIPEFHLLTVTLLFTIKEKVEFTKYLEKVSKIKVKKIMSKVVYSVKPEDTVLKAAEIMEKHDVNRLPVVKDGKLVGIIARADIIRALVE